jgi:NAD(P)H dehydrogenase (quinone)
MSLKKVLVLYYSGSGRTRKMAKAIAEAMRPSDMKVTIEEVGKFDISLLPNYDSIILGSPTYFSNVAWQVKRVIDESISHYGGGTLKDKVAGIFTSAGTMKDGKDCLKMLKIALGYHHRMKVVEGILRVDGESDKEVEKRCQEYGKKLLKEIER